MRATRVLAAAAMLAGAVAARADLTSGPQVGERVGMIEVTKVAGTPSDQIANGTKLCLRCRSSNKPAIMVFARNADEKLAELLKKVDAEVAKHEDVKMMSFVNMIGADAESLTKSAVDFVAKHDLKRTMFVVPDDTDNGPDSFHIAPDAAVTVICYREGTVKANHAFPKDGLTDETISSVIASAAALVK